MRSRRKDEHVAEALKQTKKSNDFDKIRYMHQSFPNANYTEIDTSVSLFGTSFPFPLYINAMTGGSEKTKDINQRLAKLANKYNLAMVLGSQHAALDDAALVSSYAIAREENKEGFIIANVNPNASVEEAKRAIAMLDANALSIHVNPAQELTMDEGDRDFTHWLTNIKKIVESVSVPVIVKEVGFGMSNLTVKSLLELGVQYVDVSGKGGTNFIDIENNRSQDKRYAYLSSWGLSTVESLILNNRYKDQIKLLASGGVRNPLDVVKALSLGAQSVGLSRYFLDLAHLDENEMAKQFEMFIEDIKRIMLLLGAKNISELRTKELIIPAELSRFYE